MDNRLKERLTGAAILVALVVLLVPEIFGGRGSTDSAPSAVTDEPPVRSYTFDLAAPASQGATAPANAGLAPPPHGQGAGAAAGVAATGAAAGTPAATAAGTGIGTGVAQAESASAGQRSGPAAGTAPLLAGTAEGAADATRPTGNGNGNGNGNASEAAGRAQPPAHDAAARDTVKTRDTVKKHTASAAVQQHPGTWEVQLGVFSRRDNADRLARRAEQKGFRVAVSPTGGRNLFRVHSAARLDHDGAEALRQQFRDAGFPTSLMRRQAGSGAE